MTRALWTTDEAVAATQGVPSGPAWEAIGVSIDSRTVQPGDLFVALSGPNHDGHDHVAGALEKGAAAAMVSKSVPFGPLLTVADTGAALTALAGRARSRTNAQIVAVTGSVGKTGTKDMAHLVLDRQGPTHATVGNLNNHWGAPLSLARMPRDAAFGVFELGMNHPGELTPLSRLVRPHVAIITAIEMAHSAFFADTSAIADAKAEIFLGLEQGASVILPHDSPHFAQLRHRATAAGVKHILSFGTHIDADARLLDCHCGARDTHVMAQIGDRALAYQLGVVGKHWALNSLAVLLAVDWLGANLGWAAATLADMKPPKGRGLRLTARVEGGMIEVVDESYNASPASMQAAIAALSAMHPHPGGRRIAVLGDMLELGDGAPALHAALAPVIEGWAIDLVFTAGPLMEHLRDALAPAHRGGHGTDSAAVIADLKAGLRPGDIVMIKGSAGSRMSRVVDALCGKGA